MSFPTDRPRRLRRTPALRRLVAEASLEPRHLVQPLFVKEGVSDPVPIESMPGVMQHSSDTLRAAAVAAVEAGAGGLMLFGVPRLRDAEGSAAYDPAGVLNTAISDVIAEVGDATVVMADLCLDEFTDHGHCGLLAADGSVDNDASLRAYAQMALAQAEAGVHVVGLSGMMDGQVATVRVVLDDTGRGDVAVLAYAAKYASAFYGPFRDAVESRLVGDRRSYQQDPANGVEALREVRLDVEEGADLVLVKPALGYLDVLASVAAAVHLPVGAYQVSGEYAMVELAARAGAIQREQAILETLTSIRRAGATFVLTYWATEAAGLLSGR